MNFISHECPICLDLICEKDSPATTLCCASKQYHEQCILKWLSHSNTCPTCRQHYNSIRIHHGRTVRSINVQNRVLENEAINQIPTEFIVSAGTRPEPPETESSIHSNGVCAICSSSDYRSSILNMMGCDFCGTHFHLNCLGISSDISVWCCPICDHVQNFIAPNPGRSVMRPAATALRSDCERRSPSSKPVKLRTGLVLTNDQIDLDDDFFYEPKLECHNPIINGGVLQRKEMKAKQKLTKEESYSWSIFEHARSEGSHTQTPHDEAPIKEDNTSRKKRRKPQTVNTTVASPPPSRSSSRISGLLQQLKSRKIINDSTNLTHEPLIADPQLDPNRLQLSSRQIAQPIHSSSPEIRHSTQHTGLSFSDHTQQLKLPQPQLSLEQKLIILRQVRSYLRPLYESEDDNRCIVTEDEFIALNKTISRKIYAKMQHLNKDLISSNSAELNLIVELTAKEEIDLHLITS